MIPYEQWLKEHRYEKDNYSEARCRAIYAEAVATHYKLIELRKDQKSLEESLPSKGKELWRDGW